MASPYAGGVQSPSPAAAAAAAQQQQQNHSLAFRVMRLSRPSLQPDPAALLRFDPRDVFLPEDALTGPDPSAANDFLQRLFHPPDSAAAVPGDFTFRDRFLLRDPADALALPGLLVLPQSFGFASSLPNPDSGVSRAALGAAIADFGVLVWVSRAIYLGETFCSYISINNSSSFEARDVVIKAEIQTERQRILLLDTSKSPVESIRSGGRYDFIVEHDVKELGAHTYVPFHFHFMLVCTALYNDGDGERKYLPQFFKFSVSNPLSVRTKVTSFPDFVSVQSTFCIYLKIPTASKDVDLRAVKVPPIIYAERPFMILPLVEAFESINFDLSMVATQLGVQKISGITMYAVQEKKHYEPLPDIEIFVDAE
ncbi:hypothetical protein BAE44_0012950 [Dichanthelium oligosanthes]|uniref:Trafficking protein particle complex subunit 13 N-terminal domain-containing protein n=1 Tax=Dichanthelium oligosanthes TaxID=888268 RepID=A0A1E5VLM1_9POAL|nr:hypothetical protein BAE44_0012950 [Dichanthelium oligosanthes]